MTLRLVLEDGPWRVEAAGEAGDVLVLAFASIGHDAARMPSAEFVGQLRGRRALFVMDAARSWGTGRGFADVLRRAVDAAGAEAGPVRRIVALGSSMGAVAALRACRVVPVDAVLALGPQSGADGRWPMAGVDVPDLPACWTVLCHGMADDAVQAGGWPVRAGVDHLLFGGVGHSALALHLKARGGLQGMVDALCDGDRRRLLRIAGQAGAVQRRRVPRPMEG